MCFTIGTRARLFIQLRFSCKDLVILVRIHYEYLGGADSWQERPARGGDMGVSVVVHVTRGRIADKVLHC